ncbi:hypothetical protein, partial [Bacillus amyloliquefaciens]|uniref:hypothetical protein n=1 Tax=Bacillus amyloliquefaciens TaxID=1390 RepID=UPI0006AF1266
MEAYLFSERAVKAGRCPFAHRMPTLFYKTKQIRVKKKMSITHEILDIMLFVCKSIAMKTIDEP